MPYTPAVDRRISLLSPSSAPQVPSATWPLKIPADFQTNFNLLRSWISKNLSTLTSSMSFSLSELVTEWASFRCYIRLYEMIMYLFLYGTKARALLRLRSTYKLPVTTFILHYHRYRKTRPVTVALYAWFCLVTYRGDEIFFSASTKDKFLMKFRTWYDKF